MPIKKRDGDKNHPIPLSTSPKQKRNDELYKSPVFPPHIH